MDEELEKTIDILNNIKPPTKKQVNDNWTISGWKSSEIMFDERHIIDEIEHLEYELHSDLVNNRHTTPRPFYFNNVPNILTLIGLTQGAKRDTNEAAGEGTGGVQYVSIGSNATAAVEGDTDLNTEFTNTAYSRKDLDVDGQRKVLNQTAKYGVLFDDTSFDSTPQDIKEAGLHWHTSAASKIHARVTFTTFQLNAGDLFVVQINELHANA